MKYILVLLLTTLYFIISFYSLNKMNLSSITISSYIVILSHMLLLNKHWKYLYTFIKKALVFMLILITLSSILSFILKNNTLMLITKYVCLGLITINILIPIVFDSIFMLIPKNTYISEVMKSFILFRNIISGLASDFILGIKTTPNYANNSIRNKLITIFNISISLISRIPEFSTNMNIAIKITHFDSSNLRFTISSFKSYYTATIFLILYFLIIIYLQNEFLG